MGMPSRIALAFGSLVPALVAPALAVAAAAAQKPFPPTLTLKLSSARAAARPIDLSLQLGYEMQCGYPGPGPVVLRFPAAEHVPASISRASVLVDGKAAPSVHVVGRAVSVGLAPAPQIMCDVIGPGRLRIELTRAAGLGNPANGGTYLLDAARGRASFSARFSIRG